MARKSGLGRGAGINALIPETPEVNNNENSTEIEIDLIAPNKNQPRKNFDKEKIAELALSIQEHGLVQPLIVVKDGQFYKIVAGERRWRACKSLGLKTVPAIVKDYDEKQVAEIALVENLQREDLNPIEEANGYKQLMDDFGLTQEEVSNRVQKSRSAVANSLRLLSLPQNVLTLVEEGRLSMGHARAILSAKSEEKMFEIAMLVIEKGLSVRQVEALVKEKEEKPKKRPAELNWDVKNAIDFSAKKIQDRLGAKVNVSYSNKFKGKIEINFADYKEMNRLLDLLNK